MIIFFTLRTSLSIVTSNADVDRVTAGSALIVLISTVVVPLVSEQCRGDGEDRVTNGGTAGRIC